MADGVGLADAELEGVTVPDGVIVVVCVCVGGLRDCDGDNDSDADPDAVTLIVAEVDGESDWLGEPDGVGVAAHTNCCEFSRIAPYGELTA